jgi:hypothetical protein
VHVLVLYGFSNTLESDINLSVLIKLVPRIRELFLLLNPTTLVFRHRSIQARSKPRIRYDEKKIGLLRKSLSGPEKRSMRCWSPELACLASWHILP